MRRRMLNPDFFTDPDIVASLDAYGRLLYQGIWCVADDSGCFELNPLLLKMKVLPGDDSISTDDIQSYLDTLIELDKIIVYEVDEKEYGWLKNFHKHQTLNKPNSPSVPLPEWIEWHDEDEKRHKHYYEINYEGYKNSSGKTSDRQDIDSGKTSDRQQKDLSSPEEKRKEKKLKEDNINNKRSDSEGASNDDQEQSEDKEPEEEDPDPKFDEDSNAFKAACYLRDRIEQNNPKAVLPDKIPKDMEDWAIELDRLNRLGPVGASKNEDKGYSWQEIREIIDWCQDHNFWKSNILSAGKLREQIIKLENQMKRGSPKSNQAAKDEQLKRLVAKAEG